MNKLIQESTFERADDAADIRDVMERLELSEPDSEWELSQEAEEIAQLRTKRVKVMRLRRNDLYNL